MATGQKGRRGKTLLGLAQTMKENNLVSSDQSVQQVREMEMTSPKETLMRVYQIYSATYQPKNPPNTNNKNQLKIAKPRRQNLPPYQPKVKS